MKLRRYREKMGIGFADAAEQLGISESQLSRIETGKCRPRAALVKRIAEWTEGAVRAGDFYSDEPISNPLGGNCTASGEIMPF